MGWVALGTAIGLGVLQARRRGSRGVKPRRRIYDPKRGWDYVEAVPQQGHLARSQVQRLVPRVAKVAAERKGLLGEGNFGRVYQLGNRHVVKLPAERDIHGRRHDPEELREAFRHEAGISNVLEALGHKIVPKTTYVELSDGTPALVREKGEIITRASRRDFAALERALAAVEDRGFLVRDDLLVARRPSGSLFVADVGLWKTPVEGPYETVLPDSDLAMLLMKWAREVGLDVPKGFMTQAQIRREEKRIRNLSEMDGDDPFFARFYEKDRQRVRRAKQIRGQLGLPGGTT